MAIQFSMADLEPLIREVIDKGGTFTMMPRGTSMLPLIRQGKDSVILSPLKEETLPGDVVLYKRDNGQFVLHRVMMAKNGVYTMCGDNQVVFEKGIENRHLIAIASGIIRDGKEITFSENEKYLSYTKKILSEKKRKNLFYRIRKPIKKLLKALKLIKA